MSLFDIDTPERASYLFFDFIGRKSYIFFKQLHSNLANALSSPFAKRRLIFLQVFPNKFLTVIALLRLY